MIYTLEQFSDDIRSSLQGWADPKDAVLSMGPFMQRLAREGGDLWQLGNRRPSAAACRDEGSSRTRRDASPAERVS